MKTTAIILAGGSGKRCKDNMPKQFLKIGKKTLLALCLQRFQDHENIDAIVLVCPRKYMARARRIAASFPKVAQVVPGGRARQESSAIGVAAAAGAGNILIHDAARALVPAAVIGRVLKRLAKAQAVMPVVPAGDTIVRVGDLKGVQAVLDREMLRRVQTPQGFRANVIRSAHKLARDEDFRDAGDDCSLVLRYELAPVVTVDGDECNIKVTVPLDRVIAEAILRNKQLVTSDS